MNNKKNVDFESLIGGTSGEIERGSKKYKIEVTDIPECSKACPAGINVKAYINLIANRKYEDAIEVVREANPFPAVCGRVCTRPCEDFCELKKTGDPISIRSLKRYASDYELARRPVFMEPCKVKFNEKIAIIGAGPAGLTTAVDLIRLGYPVTVFEKENEPGGMLRYAIPPYRLPDRILKREIDWIKGLGVKIKTEVKIKDPVLLFKKGFSAVLIAGGAPKSFPLDLEGEKAVGVIDSLRFLEEVNSDDPPMVAGDVIVIGGGSTAFDTARSAIRLGGRKVVIAYRRGLEEMPADKEEVEAAQQEGVKIQTLAIPKRIITMDKKVEGVEFLKAELGKPDISGRRKPVPIENSEFIIKANIVIPAVGAMPDVGSIGGVKVTTSKGLVEAAEDNQTIVEGVFAAGDVEMGPSSVVDAIGRGHHAARGIHSYLKDIPPPVTEEIANNIQISLGSRVCSKTHLGHRKLAAGGKLSSFEEVEKTITDFEAVEEATRCLTCGSCYACPVCLPNCDNKQLIAEISGTTFLIKAPVSLSQQLTEQGSKEFTLNADGQTKSMELYGLTAFVDKELCIGCGRCEEVCSYRAIKNIISKDERPVAEVGHKTCRSCSACVSECPAGAISQGYMSDKEILKRLKDKKTPYNGVKALMSYWSTPSPVFNAYEGIVELMSGRKPSPMFLISALAHSGRGLLVIKPDEVTGSHYLPWEEPPDEVIQKTRGLLKLVGVSPERIRYMDLPKGKKPSVLLEEFNQFLDEKKLGMLQVSLPRNIKSPFGKAMALLRILGAHPDIEPCNEKFSNVPMKKGGVLFFEGCLPLLQYMGNAHKLFDITNIRQGVHDLLVKTNICDGFIEGLCCPSKGLADTKSDGMEKILSKIASDNRKALKEVNPKKLIMGTPESFLTFKNEVPHEVEFLSVVDELYKKLKKSKKMSVIKRTVAVHHACKMEKDPFYDKTLMLLRLVPSIKIVELKSKCGHNGFDSLDGDSKQSAIDLMQEAVDKGVDVVICTSPYCLSHLLMCHREGSWRSVDVEISDVYSLILSSLEDDN